MNKNSKNSGSWSWLWKLLIFLFVAGLLVAIAIPNFFDGHRTSKLNVIINHLRQIDAAKYEWAIKNGLAVKYGFTNISQISQFMELTNQLTEQDLTPYLPRNFDNQGDLAPSVAGESYGINPLNEPPEAKLVRKLDGYPKGTIIRLDDSPNSFPYKIILPN